MVEKHREDWPYPKDERHGHPRFYELLQELANLHSRKNFDYAAGGNPLGNFERRAKLYSMYPGLDLSDPTVVALVDAMKQLDAALWMKSNGHTGKVEGIIDRLRDVAVYSIIEMVIEEAKEGTLTSSSRRTSTIDESEYCEWCCCDPCRCLDIFGDKLA